MLTKNEAEIIRLYTEGEYWLVRNERGNAVLRRPDGSTLVWLSVEAFNADKPDCVEEFPSWVGEDAVLSCAEGGGWFPRSEENDVVALVARHLRGWEWHPPYVIL